MTEHIFLELMPMPRCALFTHLPVPDMHGELEEPAIRDRPAYVMAHLVIGESKIEPFLPDLAASLGMKAPLVYVPPPIRLVSLVHPMSPVGTPDAFYEQKMLDQMAWDWLAKAKRKAAPKSGP